MEVLTAHITMDIDLTTTPIEGSLTADDGTLRRFTGYMQLVTVLETALQAARTADPLAEPQKTLGESRA
ncbi:MAG: hypothetical protein JO286_03455 [Solirubrobacterales bacterium]|nr:hypothetical protein [Solirubrobacterales bacterium]MBV9365146.1 hypothetical protein [Solirubrobacterales bacterium]MBV9683017.1 hypothetical protein [Solirubrobacterales bacterium]MBV9806211.1 hypothetical protein [Solirubrobacterales bacterium]